MTVDETQTDFDVVSVSKLLLLKSGLQAYRAVIPVNAKKGRAVCFEGRELPEFSKDRLRFKNEELATLLRTGE